MSPQYVATRELSITPGICSNFSSQAFETIRLFHFVCNSLFLLSAANPLCGNVTEPACQTAVHTLLSNVTLAKVQASLAEINQSCSAKVEEFTCYAHSAPCYSSEGKVLFPCRASCNEIQTACRPPMKNPLLNCFEFPGGNSTSGLCELDTWHVQEWPRRQGNTHC